MQELVLLKKFSMFHKQMEENIHCKERTYFNLLILLLDFNRPDQTA